MGTLSFQSDPILPQGYFKVDGVTAATLTTTGLSGVLYRPLVASGGQILTYDANTATWVASAAPIGGGGTITNSVTSVVNNVDNTPIGSVTYLAVSAAPVGYLECNGAIVSKSQYNDLWLAIGNTYTSVVSANHFRVPDLRGEFVRGWDRGRGVDTGRPFGSAQSHAVGSHDATLNGVCVSWNGGVTPAAGATNIPLGVNNVPSASTPIITTKSYTIDTGVVETRPRNVALLPCIKALRTVTGPTSVVQINSVNSFTIDGSMLAKAWVNFNGTGTIGTNQTIRSSYNVERVYKTDNGYYTIVFKTPFENTSYLTTGIAGGSLASGHYNNGANIVANTTTLSCAVRSDSGAGNAEDSEILCFAFYASGGDLTGSANIFDSTPVGTINYFAASAVPVGYLECNGAAVSKSDYSDLFAVIGNTYTLVVSANHFRVPDLRGEFVRGWDRGRGVDSGRVFGSNQSHSLQNHGHDLNTSATYSTENSSYDRLVTQLQGDSTPNSSAWYGGDTSLNAEKYISNIRADAGVNIGTETRPRNVALLPCIKALKTVTGETSTLNFIEKPASPTNGQVLTYNSSTATWVASAAPAPAFNPATFYTTVGNASAGIFASAVCYIPSDPGTGTWTAPAGCYTARVTIVGGGGGSPTNAGGRSHFNYPSGSTTSANQMFANGGQYYGFGGSAGWNGINTLATGGGVVVVGGSIVGSGNGGCSGGGCGGGGGTFNQALGGASYGSSIIADVAYAYETGLLAHSSGGINGAGGAGPGTGGGSPILSYAATKLSNFIAAIAQSVGRGASSSTFAGEGGGGAGWCSAIVSVTPGQSYTYAVGAAGSSGASYGMVVIEW